MAGDSARLVGEKIRQIREQLQPPMTQDEVAAMLGISRTAFQAIELGRSLKGAKAAVPVLSLRWRIPEEEFWDKATGKNAVFRSTASSRSESTNNNLIEELVDVRLYQTSSTGKVLMTATSTKLKVEAGLAKSKAYAVTANDDNAPRIMPGRKLVVQPIDWVGDAPFVLVEHLAEREIGQDGKEYSVGYVRQAIWQPGGYAFRPINPNAKTFTQSDVKVVGFIKAIIHIIAEGWTITERCDQGIPVHSP